MRTFNKQIATALALNTNRNSDYVPLKNIYLYSIMVIITGTPTGSIKLQASNDPETNDTVPLSDAPPVNWADIANTSVNVSAAGNTFYNVTDVAYNYVRVVYTDTSSGASTATAKIIVNAKGV